MQAQTPEVSAEQATTPDELRLVSVEQLKKIHRDLDACQKVIWLAGCGPRGYGFDQSYVTDAQERLKELDTLIAEPAPVQDRQQTVYVECRECSGCGHVGINDSLETNAACSRCAWIGPSPAEDTCPGCAADNVMSAACPKCGCIYRLLTDAEIYAPVAQTEQPEQSDWISVEDRLPDSGLCVLAHYTNSHGKGRRIRAEYVAPKSREVEWEYADPDTQCVEHDEESDSFYLTAGWYELIDNWEEYTSIAVVEGKVTHWLPLPAAPAMAAKAVRNE